MRIELSWDLWLVLEFLLEQNTLLLTSSLWLCWSVSPPWLDDFELGSKLVVVVIQFNLLYSVDFSDYPGWLNFQFYRQNHFHPIYQRIRSCPQLVSKLKSDILIWLVAASRASPDDAKFSSCSASQQVLLFFLKKNADYCQWWSQIVFRTDRACLSS